MSVLSDRGGLYFEYSSMWTGVMEGGINGMFDGVLLYVYRCDGMTDGVLNVRHVMV